MKKLFLFFFLLFLFICPSDAAFQLVTGIDDPNIKDIAISPFYPDLIYVASSNSLYKSKDGGGYFEKIYSFIDQEIKQIFFNSEVSNILYVVGSEHFYQITDSRKRLFSADDEEEILAAAEYKGNLYIGTSDGFYVSNQDFLRWKNIAGLNETAVFWIEPTNDYIYLTTSQGVYLFGKSKNLQRTFVTRSTSEDTVDTGLVVNKIKKDIFQENIFWLATTEGLFVSKDQGKNFKKFFISGVDSLNIISLAQTNLERNSLYLATEKGFFKINLKKRQAQALFEGLYASQINEVGFSSRGKIYLATAKGAFTNQYFSYSYQDIKLKKILRKQPSISFVHKNAISANEVSAEKIKKWRQAAALKPLFPKISLDYDKTIYGTAGGATYEGKSYVGPRDWGLSFSWDVGDFIWNPSQTSIDTRSRLNTKLRIDILEEVNRVYYERLRLLIKLKNKSLSESELLEKRLRLEELTAALDYYTGGAFFERLKELNER